MKGGLLHAGNSFSQDQVLGIMIHPTSLGYHVGFIYAGREDEGPRLLHLALHHDLRDEPLSAYRDAASLRWVPLGLEEENRLVLRGLLRRILAAQDPIPYGFDMGGLAFDENGHLKAGPAGKGLTCATFILSALKTYALQLLDEVSWPAGGFDPAWLEPILAYLDAHASPDHAEAVRLDVGARRFMPTEVAGAATSDEDGWPVGYADARKLAEAIERDLGNG